MGSSVSSSARRTATWVTTGCGHGPKRHTLRTAPGVQLLACVTKTTWENALAGRIDRLRKDGIAFVERANPLYEDLFLIFHVTRNGLSGVQY